MENYLRRSIRGARFRVDRRLDRAAVSRAHDALYLSDAWTEATWLGAQALKNPLDLWVYQEIMVETRPELIVETGTYRGGSAFYLASICDLLGAGEVVSIDVEPELADYKDLVPIGGYVIVEDSNIGQIRKDPLPGPLQAIKAFLARTDEFEIDRAREKFLITQNPSGYLRRVR